MTEVKNLLLQLSENQCKGNTFYPDGFFKSERRWIGGLYKRRDNTGFFTACIIFTLKRLLPFLTEDEIKISNKIISAAKASFELYRNKDNFETYNFWQTKPSQHFPGGFVAHRFSFFGIPDDIDDTALIHLSLGSKQSTVYDALQHHQKYIIGKIHTKKNVLPDWAKDLKPFNTFCIKFMPDGVDACALCNFLYLLYQSEIYNEEGIKDSELFLTRVIDNFFNMNLNEISPYYPDAAIVTYHLTRLWCDLKPRFMQAYENKLKNIILQLSKNRKNNNLLLNICYIRLFNKALYPIEETDQLKDYPYFVAGLLGEMHSKILREFAKNSFTQIKYYCSDYTLALLTEQNVWLRQIGAS